MKNGYCEQCPRYAQCNFPDCKVGAELQRIENPRRKQRINIAYTASLDKTEYEKYQNVTYSVHDDVE